LPAERLHRLHYVVIFRILSYLAADDLIRSFGKLLLRASHRWSQHRLAWLRILREWEIGARRGQTGTSRCPCFDTPKIGAAIQLWYFSLSVTRSAQFH
jgi:hypothetical protein